MMRGTTTPIDTSRLVDLDTLLGNRGAAGARAVRLHELSTFMDQAIAFALKNRPDPKPEIANILANTPIPTAGAWVSGPQLTLGKGVWSISAMALVETGASGIIAARLFNGASGVFATQASHPATANYFTALHLAGVISVSAPMTLTLQAAPSITSATISMIAQTTIGGALDATRLCAVKIGA